MQFSVQQGELARELALVRSSVPTRGHSAAVGNILITAHDESVQIQAIESSFGYSGIVPASVAKPGSVLVEERKLMNWVTTFNGEDRINFSVSDTHWVTMRSGKSFGRIAGRATEDFPSFPDYPPGLVSIPAEALRTIVKYVKCGMPQGYDPKLPTAQGIHIQIDTDCIRGISTTRSKLAIKEFPVEGLNIAEPFGFTLLDETIEALMKVVPDGQDQIEICLGKNQARLLWNGSDFYARLVSGKFPRTEGPLGSEMPRKAIIPAEALRTALSRVFQFADRQNNCIVFQFEDNCLALSAKFLNGDGSEILDVHYDGPEVAMALSYVHLEPFLKTAGNNPVQVRFREGGNTLWSIADDPTWRFFLATMRHDPETPGQEEIE